MEGMRVNRHIGDINEQERHALDVKEVIQVLDITRQALIKEYRLTQRKRDNVDKRPELSNANCLETLPTEILRTVIDLLTPWDIKRLSCTSNQLREVCLPSLFRRVHFEFSQDSFEELKSFLQSDVRHHVISFTYKVPELLKPGKNLLRGNALALIEPLFRNTRFRSFQVRHFNPR